MSLTVASSFEPVGSPPRFLRSQKASAECSDEDEISYYNPLPTHETYLSFLPVFFIYADNFISDVIGAK